MKLRVYVAAPYADAFAVRNLHESLAVQGVDHTSRWADHATGAEDFSKLTPMQLREQATQNDADLDDAHLCLVLARPGAGGEMFAEAARAIMTGIPVLWCGRLTLSAWRQGVTRCADLGQAIVHIGRMARSFGQFTPTDSSMGAVRFRIAQFMRAS